MEFFLKTAFNSVRKAERGRKVANGAAVGCAKSASHSQHQDPSEALNRDVTILM